MRRLKHGVYIISIEATRRAVKSLIKMARQEGDKMLLLQAGTVSQAKKVLELKKFAGVNNDVCVISDSLITQRRHFRKKMGS